MKKLLYLFLIASLWSCKTQNDIKPIQNKLSVGKSRTFFAGDGLYDVLGYGIDATRDELDPNSVSLSPIIDARRFATDYASQLSSYISQNNAGVGGSNFYSGYTALDYSNSLTTGKGISVNASGGNAVTIAGVSNPAPTPTTTPATGAAPAQAQSRKSLFTASFSKNTTDQTTNAYSSRYSYASAEVYQRVRRWAFTGSVTVNMLMNYLTPAFLNDVNTLSADALVARYGTHVLLDISIGGVLKFNYSTITSSQSILTDKTSDLEAGLGATVFGITGVNIKYNATSAQVTSIRNSNQKTIMTLQYFGGATSGQSVSIDPSGNTTQTINMGSWTASILPTNASLIGIGNALYISDFIADPTKKAAVMTAIQNHIDAAQIAVNSDPIYQFIYSTGDHFTSGDPNATGGASNWRAAGPDFSAFLGNVTGTIPVYLFNYPAHMDHYSSVDPNVATEYQGWANYGIEFYAYATQVPGTIPIYLYNYPASMDHFTSSDPNIAVKYPGWVNYGIEFYAFPKPGQ